MVLMVCVHALAVGLYAAEQGRRRVVQHDLHSTNLAAAMFFSNAIGKSRTAVGCS